MENSLTRYARHIEQLFRDLDTRQHQYYADIAQGIKGVEVVRLSDVLSKDEVKELKKYVRPKRRMCYLNAYKVCEFFSFCDTSHDVVYCEGYKSVCNVPIDHAFNKIDGKFVDITMEFALNDETFTDDEYAVIGEFGFGLVEDAALSTGFYGEVYRYVWNKLTDTTYKRVEVVSEK